MIFSFYQTALLFFIYSFFGWCVEVAFVAITLRKVQNRGFLNGPVCPIYGVGMLGVLMLLNPVKKSWILLFLGGMIICSGLELFAGWILDKIFHMRWWDYSENKFNVGGYICLAFSFMWGIAILVAVKLVHPPIFAVINKMPKLLGVILICVFAAVFIADMIVTLKKLIGIRKDLGQIDKIAEELNNIGEQLKDVVGHSAINFADKAEEHKEKLEERNEEKKEKWAEASEAAKEKLAEVGEGAKEKFAEASQNTKEKLAEVSESTRERWKQQKQELEESLDALVDSLNKYTKRRINPLPKLNKSGKSINIREYLNNLKNENKKDKE